jgi:imidazolonepropionase-like amidohydrolase
VKKSVIFTLVSGLLLGTATTLHAETLLIKGGKVYTLAEAGTLQSADILVRDGRIESVAASLEGVAADRVIDASGKVVTPGMIAPVTELGLTEISAAANTNDNAVLDESIGTAFDPLPAYNPRSTLIPFNRAGGLTRALVLPSSEQKIFAGRSFAIKLNGAMDSVVATDVAQKIYLGEAGAQLAGGSRANAFAKVKNALMEAREYAANKDAIRHGDWRELSHSVADLEALQPLISGREPMLVTVNRASDIVQVIKLAEEFNLRPIILGAAEGWMVADQLAAANVPVVIDAIDNLPISFESLGARLDNAALMNKAGVTVAISGPGYVATHNAYLSRQSAGNAVAYGLPYEEALKSVSANVAKIFGIEGGSIAPGAVADLVIWSGDPLEVTSHAEQVLIDGVPQSLVNRSTRLRDRYLKPQQGHEFGYKF